MAAAPGAIEPIDAEGAARAEDAAGADGAVAGAARAEDAERAEDDSGAEDAARAEEIRAQWERAQEERAEEALSRFLPPEDAGIVRTHRVTALLVAHEGAPWLPRTLAAVAAQHRRPDVIVAVDADSSDDSALLLREAIPARFAAGTVLTTTPGAGLAGSLQAAVATAQELAVAADGASDDDLVDDPPVGWYWILHDDSAPDPDCLERLLEGADRNPRAHVVVPKTVAWSDHGRLVGIGNRWTPGAPVVERIEHGERDQGQYDVDRAVYTGGSAGMLVRADSWAALGGIDPRYGPGAGAADLCRRVWGSGGEVWFVPQGVLAHRLAGERGVRRGRERRHSPRWESRNGQLHLELTQASTVQLPWRWLRGWVTTLVRALALLLTREPEEATAELGGAWDALVHVGALRSARQALRQPPVTGEVRPPHVRAVRGAALAHSLDTWLVAVRDERVRRPAAQLSRRLAEPLLVAAVLTVAALIRDPGQVFGSGTLRGGGLLPAPGALSVLGTYLASWQDARFGVPTELPAYLPLLSGASIPLLGSVDLLLRLAFGLAVPLAFLSAYAALGPAHRHNRTLLALGWALLPAGVAAMSGGRVSTLAVLLLGPPTARLLVTALLAARQPGSGIRPAIAAGTMLGVTAAFAPLTYGLVVAAALIVWVFRGLPRWPLRTALVTFGVAAIFVALWVPRVLRAPWLLLADVGRTDRSLGDPAPWIWGLTPGGPTSVVWAGVPLLILAVLVVLIRRSLPALAALAGVLALLAAVAWLPELVARLWPQVDPATLWPGQPLQIAAGILVLLLGVAAGGHRIGQPEPTTTTAHRLVTGAWIACLATLAVGWWLAPSGMDVGRDTGLPAVVGLDEETPAQPRALVLARDSEDALRFAVSTGPEAAIGAADAIAAPEQDPVFTDHVQALVSGAAGDPEEDLGGRGIRYVVFDGPQDDPLVAELDATSGLRRLASSASQSLWLVSGNPVRAELIATDDAGTAIGTAAPAQLDVPVTTVPTSIDVVLHPLTELPRLLRVAESFDSGWAGTLDGTALDLQRDGRDMLVAPISMTGELRLAHSGSWLPLALGQLALMAIAAVLALPKRRVVDVDGEPGR